MRLRQMKESDFYDAAIETMPVDDRERYINEKLQEIVQYAYDNAPAVRRKMDHSGVTPGDISTAKDLPKIAVTRKDDFSELQKLEPPFGGFLAVPETKDIFISPGPIYEPEIPDNQYHAVAKALYAAGFRRGDKVVVTVSFHMVPAGRHFAGAMEKLGITMIPTGVGNTELQIQIIRDLKVTGYAGTPSFLITLIKKAEELGYDFRKDFQIRHALLGAEMLPESLRRTFEQEYGIRAQQIYSTAELLLLGYECGEKSGWHIAEEVFIEIVDYETGVPLSSGEVGEIVVTPFNHIFPLIRYATGDLSSINTEPCTCGRTSPRLAGLLGRAGEAVKARGMFIHPGQVRQVMGEFSQSTNFQVKVRRQQQRDEIIMVLELKNEALDKEKITNDVAKTFQDICRLKLDKVEFVTKGTLPEERKVIIDERTWD
jgi:phenylacetate-CoA ligase